MRLAAIAFRAPVFPELLELTDTLFLPLLLGLVLGWWHHLGLFYKFN